MTTNLFKIVDGVQIELTPEEIIEVQQRQIELQQQREQRQTAEQAKIDLKASAHAKLAAIGLTPEEIASLGA